MSFYFGNLTHPSVDPPRIGFMSTVPSDASKEYQNVIASAKQNGEIFPGMLFFKRVSKMVSSYFELV